MRTHYDLSASSFLRISNTCSSYDSCLWVSSNFKLIAAFEAVRSSICSSYCLALYSRSEYYFMVWSRCCSFSTICSSSSVCSSSEISYIWSAALRNPAILFNLSRSCAVSLWEIRS